MNLKHCRGAPSLVLGCVAAAFSVRVVGAGEVDFARQVRPIFVVRCLECHGPDKQKSSLRVDSRAALLAGGDSGPAIVPGDPERSYLLELVSATDPKQRMPPKGEPLSRDQIDTIRQWIREGAKPPGDEPTVDPRRKHWAFQPVTRPEVPRTGVAAGSNVHPIDAFLAAKLAERGLDMSPEADPRTFIRRVTLDLTGLPPVPEEVECFVRECASDAENPRRLPNAAVKRLVDRLLASPHYGERWAQHWLDVIRYADTKGYEGNGIRPTAWPYRDYVIAAFNSDIPYPQFILEQLAGDTVGVDAATGFLVTPPYPDRPEVGQEIDQVAQVRFNGLDEVVQNVGSAMLGMTIGCARCHDHKFDPVSMRDYYRLVATFAGLQFADREWRGNDVLAAERQAARRRLDDLRRELAHFPAWRERNPLGACDAFEPVRAKWVRLTVANTRFQRPKYAPAFDEIEVWTAERNEAPSRNVARDAGGAVARSNGSDDAAGSREHFLNDGMRGKDSVWFGTHAVDRGQVWVEIELSQPEIIQKVAWTLDSDDQGFEAPTADHVPLSWRAATSWSIEVAEEPGQWRAVVPKDRDAGLAKAEADRRKTLEQKFAEAATELWELTHVFAGRFQTPEPAHVLVRGDPLKPRELIGPGGIDVLGGYELPSDAPEPQRRVALAKWLASEQHPLTARVMVNRVWRHHFGAGIVDTPSDFGTQGERPTHPELLDWLAAEFSDSWSLKRLHRLICNSRAYRQSSRPNAKAIQIDADARLLWRFPPRRLDAEAIRDGILCVAGSLDLGMGGPAVNLYKQLKGSSEWIPDDNPGPKTWRRTAYLVRARGANDGVFKAFDVPDCGQVRAKRGESTTPLQALNLFNSPFVIRQSQLLASRAQQLAGDDRGRQIEQLFELTLARSPGPEEQTACLATIEQDGLAAVCRALLNSNEFLFLK